MSSEPLVLNIFVIIYGVPVYISASFLSSYERFPACAPLASA